MSGFLRILVGLFLLAAAAGKAWSIGTFAFTLGALIPIIPAHPALAPMLAAGIVLWECSLALAFLLRWRPHLIAWSIVLTLVVFIGVHIRIMIDPTVNTCACFGDLPILSWLNAAPAVGIVQNLILIAAVVFSQRPMTLHGGEDQA